MQPRAASLSGRTAGSLRAKGINEDTVKYKSYSKCEDALVFAKVSVGCIPAAAWNAHPKGSMTDPMALAPSLACSSTSQWTPSQHIADLEHPSLHAEGYRPKPEVVQLLNIAEHTHKVSPKMVGHWADSWAATASEPGGVSDIAQSWRHTVQTPDNSHQQCCTLVFMPAGPLQFCILPGTLLFLAAGAISS